MVFYYIRYFYSMCTVFHLVLVFNGYFFSMGSRFLCTAAFAFASSLGSQSLNAGALLHLVSKYTIFVRLRHGRFFPLRSILIFLWKLVALRVYNTIIKIIWNFVFFFVLYYAPADYCRMRTTGYIWTYNIFYLIGDFVYCNTTQHFQFLTVNRWFTITRNRLLKRSI